MGSSERGDVCVAPALAPEARSEAEERQREDVDGLLAHLWRERTGFGISLEEEEAIARAGTATHVPKQYTEPGKKTSTYGEVTPVGVRQIARALGIDSLAAEPPVVFMDLGSGVGKLVVQAHLEFPAVVRAVGVELSSSRSSKARAAWQQAAESGEAEALRAAALRLLPSPAPAPAPPGEAVVLAEGDLFDMDVAEVTHAYVASLCFNEAMLLRLGRKLAAEAPRLQAVAALRRFPLGILGFEAAGSLEAEMTWTRYRGGGQTVYLYRRRADTGQEQ